jgi:hypothetical protein
MKTQDLVLLPLTVYGTPSGNYDGSSDTAFAGNRQKAVGYYRRPSGIQTVQFDVDDFVGNITVQATLDDDPTVDSEWFNVFAFPEDSSATTADVSYSIKGNFTWIRARVFDFLGGQINSVTVTY